MKWFFALNEEAPHYAAYSDMIKVAVHTAWRCTRLEPYFLYDGSPCALTAWLAAHGVTVVPRRWRLMDEFRRVAVETQNTAFISFAGGAFLRTEVPAYCREQGWADEQVLYTDCDIMFTGDPESLWPDLRGAFFGAAPEIDAQDLEAINSGVMLMRLPALWPMEAAFDDFIRRNMAECTHLLDQFAYRTFFRHGWKSLSNALNWKPYWGENPDARIVHFHGPKPFLRTAIATGQAVAVQQELARGAFAHYCRLWDEALAAAG